MQHPRQPHLDAILQISRYITKTVDYGILYTNNSSFRLASFIDVGYAGDVDKIVGLLLIIHLAWDLVLFLSTTRDNLLLHCLP